MGITGTAPSSTVISDLETMATDTGAVDASGPGTPVPIVVDGADSGAADGIADGIRILAGGIPLDLAARTIDDTSDSVNAITAFVDHLETLQLGTAMCEDGLTDTDTNADGFDDAYQNVVAGTPVCWKVVSKQNTTVPATQEPQLFRATVEVTADGITVVDTRDVFFLVPPVPFDPPVE
jgi:hypothetical protein